jgi:hypothetical protein
MHFSENQPHPFLRETFVRGKHLTYKILNPIKQIKPILVFKPSCRPQKTRAGISVSTKSVAELHALISVRFDIEYAFFMLT